MRLTTLIRRANKARENAWATRSEHRIGAVIETKTGAYDGANVESNISGLGICAERMAINHAISHGDIEFTRLVTFDDKPITPCGVCAQYLVEFASPRLEIIAVGANGEIRAFELSQLVPYAHTSKRNQEKKDNMKGGYEEINRDTH